MIRQSFFFIFLIVFAFRSNASSSLDSLMTDLEKGINYFKEEMFHLNLNIQVADTKGKNLEPERSMDILGNKGELSVRSGSNLFLYSKRFTLNVNFEKRSIVLNEPQEQTNLLSLNAMLDSSFIEQIAEIKIQRDSAGNKFYQVSFLPGYHCIMWKIGFSRNQNRVLSTELSLVQIQQDGTDRQINFSNYYRYQEINEPEKLALQITGNQFVQKSRGNYIPRKEYSSYAFYNYLKLN
ncbi:hypothetical protein MASR2M44_24800 [Bacteroidota bacterium]